MNKRAVSRSALSAVSTLLRAGNLPQRAAYRRLPMVKTRKGFAMLRTIFVPLDGSVLAEQALAYAERIAGTTSAKLVLSRIMPLNIIEPAEDDLALADEARSYLRRVVDRLSARATGRERYRLGSARPAHPRVSAGASGGPGGHGYAWPFGARSLVVRQRRR